FAELVAGACNPIDDVRGTARYRRHAIGVLARRQLGWTWDQYRPPDAPGPSARPRGPPAPSRGAAAPAVRGPPVKGNPPCP
ncbi:hypothetical protein L1885_25910, partial [Streptomyces fuscigenes]|nr:hypothetical protein [Streptomyces fuscigenes]